VRKHLLLVVNSELPVGELDPKRSRLLNRSHINFFDGLVASFSNSAITASCILDVGM